MLSWNFIVERIKIEMSHPFQMLEKTDDEIIDYLKLFALRKFEQYFPQKWRVSLNCSDPSIKVPGRQSEYYIIDPDERQIKNIVAFIPAVGPMIMNNHPWFGPWTTSGVEEWHLSTYNSNLLKPFSNFNYNHEFIPPNMIRISPIYSGRATIEYERSHDPELSTIHPELEDVFTDLSLSMFMMMIGRIRQKYTTTNTPFGDIPLNGDLVFNDGKELYDRTIDLLKMGSLPNVSFDYG